MVKLYTGFPSQKRFSEHDMKWNYFEHESTVTFDTPVGDSCHSLLLSTEEK